VKNIACSSYLLALTLIVLLCSAGLQSAEEAWHWAGRTSGSAVTILLLGDINIENRADPADAFRNVHATLNSADLVYGNLEGLLVKSRGPGKDIPDKNGWQHIGPEAVQALKAGHIRVVGVANNVAYGPDNIMKSLAVLDSNDILHTGAGANLEEAHKPAIILIKGVRIGFLQYTAKWYAQDQQIATADRPGVARILSRDGITIEKKDLNRFHEDIRRLRPLVDILVVSSHDRDGLGQPLSPAILAETRPETAAHAEEETKDSLFSPIPLGPQFSETETYQKTLAHEAIDAGADVVYGHGSHVLQGVEIYKGKPVMYCLGNFAMDWIRMSPNKEGMVARVVIENKRVARLSLVPLTRDEQNNVLMLDPASDQGSKLMEKVKKLSGVVQLNIEGKEAVLIGR
jgi:poly-gamma-glutamate capsule biosynthesis protein CapA/YwtB (metallophosphatase superfamily)